MDEYNFLADLLNKFSQFTPWIQALAIFIIGSVFLSLLYVIKVALISKIKQKIVLQILTLQLHHR